MVSTIKVLFKSWETKHNFFVRQGGKFEPLHYTTILLLLWLRSIKSCYYSMHGRKTSSTKKVRVKKLLWSLSIILGDSYCMDGNSRIKNVDVVEFLYSKQEKNQMTWKWNIFVSRTTGKFVGLSFFFFFWHLRWNISISCLLR